MVAACGRRWGKTESIGVDATVRLLTEPDLGQLIVAPTQDQAAGLFDVVVSLLEDLKADEKKRREFPDLAGLVWKWSPYPHIRRKRDKQVVFAARSAGRTGRNLRGRGTTRKLKRFRVVVDEAAFVPQEVIDNVVGPMLATTAGGGQLVAISSPFGLVGWFVDYFNRGERKEKRYRSVRLPSSQNPRVSPEFLAEQKERLPERVYRAEYLAEFVSALGAIFAEEDILAAVCDEAEESPLFGIKYVAGIDFGRRKDWTVVTIGAIEPTGVRVVRQYRWQGLTWGRQVTDTCDALLHWGVKRIAYDRTGVGDSVGETLQNELIARRVGIEVDEFLFTSVSKRQIVDACAIALSARKLRFPPSPELMQELRAFEVVNVSVTGHERMEARQGHDDCVMALCLLMQAASPWIPRQWIGGIGSVGATAGQRETAPGRKPGRPIGSVGGGKSDAEFSCSTEYLSGYQGFGSPHARMRAETALRLSQRLLQAVYRFGAGRAAGALLHQITSRTPTNTRPARPMSS